MRPTAYVALAAGMCAMVAACGSSPDDGEDADAARGAETTKVSGTATRAGECADEVTNSAGDADHVDAGTEMTYSGVPPVSGKHWETFPDIAKLVYLAEERPELGQLVHSQEHGWTIVWYDESVARDETAMAALSEAAGEVEDAGAQKVVFMPWTSDDGDAFPGGAHVALTHWGAEDGETEHRQFCDQADAQAILAFSERNPYTDSREPDAP